MGFNPYIYIYFLYLFIHLFIYLFINIYTNIWHNYSQYKFNCLQGELGHRSWGRSAVGRSETAYRHRAGLGEPRHHCRALVRWNSPCWFWQSLLVCVCVCVYVGVCLTSRTSLYNSVARLDFASYGPPCTMIPMYLYLQKHAVRDRQ